VAQPPGRAPGKQLTPGIERDRKDVFMADGTTPVSLCFARWPRSPQLLGATVGPGSHLSLQCPVRESDACELRICVAPREATGDTADPAILIDVSFQGSFVCKIFPETDML
jgi:hypothetical protein